MVISSTSLKRAIYNDGTTHLKFTQEEFIEKLMVLVPPPRGNLIRICGVLAPNSKWRKKVVPKVPRKNVDGSNGPKCYWIPWSELLKRVYLIDVFRCDFCFGRMKVLAMITEKKTIKKILDHLHLPSEPIQLDPARGPPDEGCYF